MENETSKIEELLYQRIEESFRDLSNDKFPIRLEHSYGDQIIDTVHISGSMIRRRLFAQIALDAMALFKIPGTSMDEWLRVVVAEVPEATERNPQVGGGILFLDSIENVAEASIAAMRRLYPKLEIKLPIIEPIEIAPRRRKNRTKAEKLQDEVKIIIYISANPTATRDDVATNTGIAGGTVSASQAWQDFSKSKRKLKKANRAISGFDMDSFSS